MPIPVFVDEILCRHFADGSKPLRTPWAHPDEVAGGYWIPGISEAVNAAALEHEEAVFHDVHLHQAERGAGLIDHGVDREIELHFVWKQALHLQSGIVVERMRRNLVFAGNDRLRWFGGC